MGLMDTLHFYLMENTDPRVRDWPLVQSLTTVPMIYVIYLIAVFYVVPRYMENRPPYSLKRFIQFFDIFQIVANSWIVYGFFEAGWYQDIFVYCVPMDYSYSPNSIKLAKVIWWVLIMKLVDLIETVIYILRKKNNQVSFLHLYHHISTGLLGWFCARYIAGGMAVFVPLVNCSVHVIMYTYYFLTSLGPKVQKIILPYKPLLTIIQMVQFIALILHILQTLLPSCKVPKYPGPLMIVNLLINLYLFYDFYRKTYKDSKVKEK